MKISAHVGTVIAPGNGITASRKGNALLRAENRRHAQQIGSILHAWNLAHAELFALFRHVVADGDHELARAMWCSVSSDKGQRDILRAAVEIKLKKRRSLRTAALWAISALDEIGTASNDAAHTEMTWYFDHTNPDEMAMIPGLSAKNSSADRLVERPIASNWKKIVGDLNALGHYLEYLNIDLWMGHKRPSCRRPKLQFVRGQNAARQAQLRRAQKASRQRQRQSSRA